MDNLRASLFGTLDCYKNELHRIVLDIDDVAVELHDDEDQLHHDELRRIEGDIMQLIDRLEMQIELSAKEAA